MNKSIQTIVVTALIFSPLSITSLATSAAAHHTSSHVSTVSTNFRQVNKVKTNSVKKQVRLRKGINRSI
jgi:hypothetical protein